MKKEIAIKQLKAIEDLLKKEKLPRLAADGWEEKWKTLIAIMLSAQTRDAITIPVSERLFKNYPTLEKLSKARVKSIEENIKSINYHKTKARRIKETTKILLEKGLKENFDELIKLPGVGRKTANVFLVAIGKGAHIGVDTHVFRISRKLNWSSKETPKNVEEDLMKLFPKKYWNRINYMLVSFGQTYGKSRIKEDKILEEIKKIK